MTIDTALKKIEKLTQQNTTLASQNKDLKAKVRALEEKIRTLAKALGLNRSWYSERTKKRANRRNLSNEEREEQKKRAVSQANMNRGAKPGHQGQNRNRKEADRHIHITLKSCPHCHHEIVGGQSEKYSRQFLELINIPLLQIHEFHFYQAHCSFCQQTVSTGISNLPEIDEHQFIGSDAPPAEAGGF